MGRGSNQSAGALLGAAIALIASFALALPAAAGAQSSQPLGPWDGTNPFRCVNQDVGKGTDFPHPNADPFCVEFDKTSQNVTDFGIVDFASQEPSRVSAAGDKCFYFQHDHWTGSIVQGGDPELWHWDGSYFFDRAKGVGGVYVTNFRVGGQPMDASPYVPPAYRPYVSPTGGGGVRVLLESDPDPSCVKKVDTPAERDKVYADRPQERHCAEPGGGMGARHVGPAKLGMAPDRLRKRLGPPDRRRRGSWRWCVVGGSSLRVAFTGKAARRGAALIRTDARGQHMHGVGPGDRRRRAVRRLDLRPMHARAHGRRVWAGRGPHRTRVVAGTRGGRVKWLAIADRRRLHGRRAVLRAVRRVG
jgi:hypothetical protein